MEKYIDNGKKLGKGSFGMVKLVQRKEDQKYLAMKIIDLGSEEAAKTAYNEPNILETLQHPNIVKFYETFVLKESLHLVMEYCEQGDLQQKVKEAKSKGEYFDEDQIFEWFVQVCLATRQLHEHRIIHRDIKVHNIFLTSEGLVKLGDFGISKQLEHTGDMGTTWLGTPVYVSPEMLSHCVSTYKSDSWMLGCLLYELCTLEKPFPGDNISTVMRRILHEDYVPIPGHFGEVVQNLIKSLLQKNPENRLSIDQIFEIPEIRGQIELLRIKHFEEYNSGPFLDFLKNPSKQEQPTNELKLSAKRWASDKIKGENQLNIDGASLKQIGSNQTPVHMNIAWELPEQSNDFVPQAQVLGSRKLNQNTIVNPNDSSKPPIPDLQAVKWKSTNIRALVEQRKATISPSNAEKSTPSMSISTTAIHTPLAKSVSVQANPQHKQSQDGIIKPIRVASVQLERVEPSWEEKKFPTLTCFEGEDVKAPTCENEHEESKYDEKTASSLSKKHHRLSINIPIGPEQGESQSQVSTEKAQPILKSSKSPMNGDPSTIPTTKVEGVKKSFAFSDYIFDKKLPTSPNRTFWVSQFLRQKLGDEKFEKVKDLIESSNNPTQLLKEQPEKVLEIIGNEKRDCLVMLSFLISHNANSVTPTGEAKGPNDKCSYVRAYDGNRNIRNFKSPISANPFLRNVFPCATEPDSVGSQSPIEDIRSSRRISSEMFKQKEKFEPFSASLPNSNENPKDAN